MADDSIFLFIPGKLVNFLNAHTTNHWGPRKEYNARWRENVVVILRSKFLTYPKNSPESRIPKVIRMHAIVARRFDSQTEGLRAALKPVVDGLQDAGIIHSDADGCGHIFEPPTQAVGRRKAGVEIGIRLA